MSSCILAEHVSARFLLQQRLSQHPPTGYEDALWFDGEGLHIGSRALIPHPGDVSARALSKSLVRLETLLAVIYRKHFISGERQAVIDAAAWSRGGDQAAANLRLATSRLVRIPYVEEIDRQLELANILLDEGMAPDDLLDALDIGSTPPRCFLGKYSQDQPRVPAGNGRESGEFGGGGGSASVRPALLATAPLSLLASTISAVTLEALATLAATAAGAAAVLGVLFVPWQNSSTSSGTLTGGLTYSFDQAGGRLEVRDAAGKIVIFGRRDVEGIFHDVETGTPFARVVGSSLMFVPAAILKPQEQPGPGPGPNSDEEHPKLCPEPSDEKDNGAKERARRYQEQISAMINPQRPLKYGLAMAFFNSFTRKWVIADECDEADGSLIEAKGPGYAGLLTFPAGQKSQSKDWEGKRQHKQRRRVHVA